MAIDDWCQYNSFNRVLTGHKAGFFEWKEKIPKNDKALLVWMQNT